MRIPWFFSVIIVPGLTILSSMSVADEIKTYELKFEKVFEENDDDENYTFSELGAFDIAVDDKGKIYITDRVSKVVKQFDSNGKYVRTFGGPGQGPGEFSYPMDLQVLNNKLIVRDGLRRHFFNLNGELIRTEQLGEFEGKCGHMKHLSEYKSICMVNDWKALRVRLAFVSDEQRQFEEIDSYDARGMIGSKLWRGKKATFTTSARRTYRFALNSKGDVSFSLEGSKGRVYLYSKGKKRLLLQIPGTAIEITERDRKRRERALKSTKTMSQEEKELNILRRTNYRMITDIQTDEKDNIWIRVRTNERYGWLKCSSAGKILAFYDSKDISFGVADTLIKNNYLYYLTYDQDGYASVRKSRLRD